MEYTGRYWHDGYHYVAQDSMSQMAVVSRMNGDYDRMELTVVKAMPSWGDAIDYARKLTRAEQQRLEERVAANG